MTVIADSNKCVVLPAAQPGDRFDVRIVGEGKFVLTLLDSDLAAPATVKVEKRNGFSVGVLDHPIDDQALAEALREFP